MDAITLLKRDHKTVEGLFKRSEKTGPNAQKTQRDLADKIIKELSVHAADTPPGNVVAGVAAVVDKVRDKVTSRS